MKTPEGQAAALRMIRNIGAVLQHEDNWRLDLSAEKKLRLWSFIIGLKAATGISEDDMLDLMDAGADATRIYQNDAGKWVIAYAEGGPISATQTKKPATG